jgi:hypothetical protein
MFKWFFFNFVDMVQLMVKFRFFIQELWERKSLQIMYECWRRVYRVLLAQLFIYYEIKFLRGWEKMPGTQSIWS